MKIDHDDIVTVDGNRLYKPFSVFSVGDTVNMVIEEEPGIPSFKATITHIHMAEHTEEEATVIIYYQIV